MRVFRFLLKKMKGLKMSIIDKKNIVLLVLQIIKKIVDFIIDKVGDLDANG